MRNHFSKLATIFIIIFTSSCEDLHNTFNCEEERTVNKIYVQEFIIDKDFKNISPLRSYSFGSDDELNVVPNFDYTIDGSVALSGYSVANYGAELSTFDSEFSLTGNNKFNDYDNIQDKFISSSRSTMYIKIPEHNDSVALNLDLALEYENSHQSNDTLFSSSYEFADSSHYKINNIQHLEYSISGEPILLVNDRVNTIEYSNGGYNRTSDVIGSHLIQVFSDTNYDTLYTYFDETDLTSYDQIYFSVTKAGTFIKINGKVFLLNDKKELKYLYSGSLPDRSNLDGNAILTDYKGQYYDVIRDKDIDLPSFFTGTDQIIYGYPSNNELIALKLSGTSSLNNNQERIFIYDTNLEAVIDSITTNDLNDFGIEERISAPGLSDIYTKLTNPIFTSDNRLIFMYVYEEFSSVCN